MNEKQSDVVAEDEVETEDGKCCDVSFRNKKIIGACWVLFGFAIGVSLLTIQLYQILIYSNKCLFYAFNPQMINETK